VVHACNALSFLGTGAAEGTPADVQPSVVIEPELGRTPGEHGPHSPPRAPMHEVLEFSWRTLLQIESTIGDLPSGQGGVLGGETAHGIVWTCAFGKDNQASGLAYALPNDEALDRLLAEQWHPNGIDLLGIVVSHPAHEPYPNHGDIAYARRLLRANPNMTRFLLPIVIPTAERDWFEIIPFAVLASTDGNISVRPMTLVLKSYVPPGSSPRHAVAD